MVEVVGHSHEAAEEPTEQNGSERGVDLCFLCDMHREKKKQTLSIILQNTDRRILSQSFSPRTKRSIWIRVML